MFPSHDPNQQLLPRSTLLALEGDVDRHPLWSILSPFQKILLWIAFNFSGERAFKQKQLWIYGPPSVGKTTLCNTLCKYYNPYIIPLSTNGYWNGYIDNHFDFAFGDDCYSNYSITEWNRFVQGGRTVLNPKLGVPVTKTQNLPVIITSNLAIDAIYTRAPPVAVNALRIRFIEIEVKEFIDFSSVLDIYATKRNADLDS